MEAMVCRHHFISQPTRLLWWKVLDSSVMSGLGAETRASDFPVHDEGLGPIVAEAHSRALLLCPALWPRFGATFIVLLVKEGPEM